ncbi:MAG TPA: Gfo/Idh/MocA family oxidoreductase [Methylomirabilota bacterium]|nr:Gfo/Idh/MocA family oxidoreductase [Methylomirabilota bacterium]
MMTERYRAAVIGCGRIGVTMEEDVKRILPATHAGAYRACARTELAALVDVDRVQRRRAEAIFPGTRAFDDVDEMLERVRPAIVSVATPPAAHRAAVEAAARHGVRVVICEKPLAASVDEGRAMIAACAASDTALLVNHTRRFDPLLRRLRDDIVVGELGDITQATAYYTAGLFNSGTHMIDLMRFFLGEVSWGLAVANGGCPAPAGDANVDALLGFVSGARAALQVQDVQDYAIFTLRLHGRRGTAVVDRFGFEVERTPVRDCAEFSGYKELDVHGTRWDGQSRSFMAPLVEHAVACLEGRDQPVSRGEDGLAALEVLFALKTSAERGGEVIQVGTGRRA